MWQDIVIEGAGIIGGDDSDAELGLDLTAKSMHERFLADMEHLDAVRLSHERIVAEVSGGVNASLTSARGFDSPSLAFDQLDGSVVETGFDLELNINSLTDLSVSTIVSNENRKVRIIAPERFGGLIHTLSLPPSVDVESATLNDGRLSLRFR